MTISLSLTFITVDDHDRALTFYRDALGLEVRNDGGFGEFRWVSVGAPEQPDVTIVLESPLPDPSAAEEDRGTVADLMARGLLRCAIFATDDCDAVFDQVRAAGGEVLQEPVDRPYGVRECAFRDPAGNMVQFHQALVG